MIKVLILLPLFLSYCHTSAPLVNPCMAILCPENTSCEIDSVTKEAKCVPINHVGSCPEKILITKCQPCKHDGHCAINQKCCKNCCRKACFPVACKCPFGTIWYFDSNGCRLCKCKPHPCSTLECKPNYRCELDPDTLNPICVAVGTCPVYKIKACLPSMPIKPECKTDSDCTDGQKCCSNPCSPGVCVDPCVDSVDECKCDSGLPFLINYQPEGTIICKKCSCNNPCMYTKCSAGFHCEVKDVICIKAPCNPISVCVPDKCKKGDPLQNVTCGRGGVDCPNDYYCEIASDDSYAVCCPKIDPCEGLCKPGEKCILKQVECKKPPCDPIPECIPICPFIKCDSTIVCPNGYAIDKNGCRTCECA